MPVAALFMVINIIIGCYVAIRFGYGPPDWKTALNLVIRVTTLQDRLNEGRKWLDKKAPWTDRFLDRLHVPKPIIIVDIPEEEEENDELDGTSEANDKAADEQTEDFPDVPVVGGSLDDQEPSDTEPGHAESADANESSG